MNAFTHALVNNDVENKSLKFLWIELTNKCNLECTHCYANSSPKWVDTNPISLSKYQEILTNARENGCEAIQFIGGEPVLNKLLPDLIDFSKSLGFSFVEVYTNLVAIQDSLISKFKQHDVKVATSIYSSCSEIHDKVTLRTGSWFKTVSNIKKLVNAGVDLRASFIEMEVNQGEYEKTVNWLKTLGLTNFSHDEARQFGRQNQTRKCDMGELCGECSKGTLCVDPSGKVFPCIMSKSWQVGNIIEQSLAEILTSIELQNTRKDIYLHTLGRLDVTNMGGCNPSSNHPCNPDQGGPCNPCSPNGHCGPNACAPK